MANRVLLGNVKGEVGATGATGATGQAGANGLTPYILNGTWWIGTQDTGQTAEGNKWITGAVNPTTEGNEGDLYLNTATLDVFKKSGGVWTFQANIKGAKGENGAKGEKGETALSVVVGTTITGEAGSLALVENVGTNKDLVLKFTIPKGEKGEQGEQGIQGVQGIQGDRGEQGEKGADGTMINVAGEAVESLDFTSDPQAQIDALNARIDGSAEEAFVFDLFAHFVSWLAGNYARADGRTTADLKIGSEIYIKESGYPDYWCSSLAEPFSTENFTAYETKVTELDGINEKVDTLKENFEKIISDVRDRAVEVDSMQINQSPIPNVLILNSLDRSYAGDDVDTRELIGIQTQSRNGQHFWNIKDATARESIATLESQIGDIGALLDIINGEVI